MASIAKESISEGASPSLVCETIGVSPRTLRRWARNPHGDLRRGPKSCPANKLSEKEREEILTLVNSPDYRDMSVSQIVPKLADKGKYLASEATIYRILKNEGLNAHRGKSKEKTGSRPKELSATKPNEVYSWDITYLKSSVAGMFFYLYLVVDIYSRKIMGFHVSESQSSEEASNLFENICKNENIEKGSLRVHSDNGSPMKGATTLATFQKLGIIPTFSRPSVSNDNPFSEALFRTTKYCPMYPSRPFASVEEAKEWARKFVNWYNETHMHSGIKFTTPASRHKGEDVGILLKRKSVYEKAKSLHPNRWSKGIRDWSHIGRVYLNRLKEKKDGGSHDTNALAA